MRIAASSHFAPVLQTAAQAGARLAAAVLAARSALPGLLAARSALLLSGPLPLPMLAGASLPVVLLYVLWWTARRLRAFARSGRVRSGAGLPGWRIAGAAVLALIIHLAWPGAPGGLAGVAACLALALACRSAVQGIAPLLRTAGWAGTACACKAQRLQAGLLLAGALALILA